MGHSPILPKRKLAQCNSWRMLKRRNWLFGSEPRSHVLTSGHIDLEKVQT